MKQLGISGRMFPRNSRRSMLTLFLMFLGVNITLFGLFMALVVAPRLGDKMDGLRDADLRLVAGASAMEFNRYFDGRIKGVQDLATYPHILHAMMHGGRIHPDLVDYFANRREFGEKMVVRLLDINQEAVYTTPGFDIDLRDFRPGWFAALMGGELKAEVRLFPLEGSRFQFAVAVPVMYEGMVEGVVVSQMGGDLADFSVLGNAADIMLRLCEGEHCSQQVGEVPDDARWISHGLSLPDMSIALIVDQRSYSDAYRQLSNDAFGALLATLVTAFAIFAFWVYPILVRPYQAMEKQADELSLLGSVMENAVEGVACIDKEGRFNLTNEAFNRLCGFSAGELDGYSWRRIVEARDWPLVEKAFAELEKKDKVSLEVLGKRDDGTSFFQAVTLVSAPSEGGHLSDRVFYFLKDISQRKKYEQQLQVANKELESFAYRVSHDLRAPLMSIKGLLGLAERSIDSGKLELASEAVNKSRNAVLRLDHTVDDVLTLSCMEHQDDDVVEVDLQHMVDEVMQQLCKLENYDRIRFDVDVDDVGSLVTGAARLEQILSNLLSNAIKYADLHETPPVVGVTAHKSAHGFSLTVEDNGIGIPPQAEPSLFGMFKRFHSQKAYGSGLGLYLVKKNAEGLGGTIDYEPKEKGSRFVLRIPQQREEKAA